MFSFNTIRSKLMVPTLFLTVLLLSLLGMFLAIKSFASIKSMVTAKADLSVNFLSKVSISSYKNFEYFDLDILVQEISKDPEVDFAVFYDANKVALTKETGKSSPSFLIVERKISDETGKHLGSVRIGYNRLMLDTNLRNNLIILVISIIVAIFIFLFGMKILTERIIIRRIEEMETLSNALAAGDMTVVVNATGHDEIASLGSAMNKMAARLKALIDKIQSRNIDLEEWQKNELWIKSGLNDLNTILRGDHKIAELADKALNFLISYLGGGIGVLYRYDEKNETLHSIASYAIPSSKSLSERIHLGEGLAGQAALERKMICINSVPHHYLPICSALGEADPSNIIVLPIMHNELLTGVLEIGSFRIFTDIDLSFLHQATEGIAVAINVNRSRELVNELLEQTQQQSEELRVQQEELQQANEVLKERTKLLTEQRRMIAETA
jgi:methyl-accepting chemotaxis protein